MLTAVSGGNSNGAGILADDLSGGGGCGKRVGGTKYIASFFVH